jgi:hypothetical protein
MAAITITDKKTQPVMEVSGEGKGGLAQILFGSGKREGKKEIADIEIGG